LFGETKYEQHLVGPLPGPVQCSSGISVDTTECLQDVLPSFDIVVVPGSSLVGEARRHRELVDWLSDAGRGVRRLASVSNGACLVERAGLTDKHCSSDRKLYSSRGATDSIEMALLLVSEDLGEETALGVAKSLSRQCSWIRF
jgi:transcriptional regulator GlxA family with amidase domain